MSDVQRPLTVDDLAQNEAIFVINKSKGDICINVANQNQRLETIHVPRTWVPIQLTNFIAPKFLLDSNDFRRVVAKGKLALVTKEEAYKIQSTPEAKKEIERLRNEYFKNVAYGDNDDNPTAFETVSTQDDSKVSFKVKDILLQDISDEEKVNALDNEFRMDEVTKDDIEFILATVDSRSDVHKWANKKLTSVKS